MRRFWGTFKGYLQGAAISPAIIVVANLLIYAVRWAAQQLLSQEFLIQFNASVQRHNVPAALFKLVEFAESNPVGASLILAAVAVAYGAIRSEIELRIHPERYPVPAALEPTSTPQVRDIDSVAKVPAVSPVVPNIIAIRAEVMTLEEADDAEIDSATGQSLPGIRQFRALVATFHNQPLPDRDIASANKVTASYHLLWTGRTGPRRRTSGASNEGYLDRWLFLAQQSLDFAIDSVRQLILARQNQAGKFVALDSRDSGAASTLSWCGWGNQIPLNRLQGSRCSAVVQLTINGRVSEQHYEFNLALGRTPWCEVASDFI